MKLNNTNTLGVLLLLTLCTALFSIFGWGKNGVIAIILILSGVKFLLVAFRFMDMYKAHRLWKLLLVGYLLSFISIVLILLK